MKNVLVGRDSNLSISIEQIAQFCTVTILLSAISQQSFSLSVYFAFPVASQASVYSPDFIAFM